MPSYDDGDKEVYLIFEGKFIKAMLITIYSILGLSFLSIIVVAICVCKRHRQEDRMFSESGSDAESMVTQSRQSAFTKALDPDYEAAMRESSRNEEKKNFFGEEEGEAKTPLIY